MTIPPDILDMLKPTPHGEIWARVRDAELLLCLATDSGARARCYQAAGVTPHWDKLGFIAPADFANDPNVEAVAQIQTR